jgi:copper transport protein
VSSTPEPGATLSTAPGVVTLEFTEPLNVDLSRARVTTPDGDRVHGSPSADQRIAIPLGTNATGIYRVDWTTVSTVDGHTLTGSFAFGVGVEPGAASSATTQEGPGRADLAVSVARTVEDAALLLAIGLLLLGRLARRGPRLPWVRARPTSALVVATLAGCGVVVGEAVLAGGSEGFDGIVTYLTSGTPGAARLVRPLLELVAVVASIVRPRWTVWPLLGAVAALGVAGHAAAVSPRWWGMTVEVVHLVSVGVWVGGIFALALQRPPGGWRGESGLDLLGRFTRVALPAFVVTAATGVIRGLQEVGGLDGLIGSAYGVVLLGKIVLVLVMVQLSVFAWRRIVIRPGLEALVALMAIGAAALLAAFPLPPARLAEAETEQAAQEASARDLPGPGELSLGSNAGEFLVGLTVRPDEQELAIHVLGLEGPRDDATRVVTALVEGRNVPVSQCGPSCRVADAAVRAGHQVTVSVDGPRGGEARFAIPDPDAPPADGMVAQMTSAMEEVASFRLLETLDSGRAVIRSSYAMRAPDAIRVRNVGAEGEGSEIVWIGDTRYQRMLPDGEWQVDQGAEARVPTYVWDSFEPFVGARLIGRDRVGGTEANVVTFFGGDRRLPVWFRLWIDRNGLVLRARMDAPGHFMDQRYRDFGADVRIEPPI